VPLDRVFGLPDSESIYSIPLALKESKIDTIVMDHFNFRLDKEKAQKNFSRWAEFVKNRLSLKDEITIGITGKYTGLRDSYASIIKALEHAGVANQVKVNIKWIETTSIEKGKVKVEEALKDVSGIIVPGGFGKRGVEGKIACVKYARENKVPYLGLCYGFQVAIIDFARHVCGLKNSNTTETDKGTKHPVIDILPEQMKIKSMGGNMRLGGHDVELKPGTKAYDLFGKKKNVRLRFRHRYECNPEYIKTFEKNGMVFSGKAPKRPIMQILELPENPFFIGTQSHPEFSSRPLKPQPLFKEFVRCARLK
jgi:CTP synthase